MQDSTTKWWGVAGQHYEVAGVAVQHYEVAGVAGQHYEVARVAVQHYEGVHGCIDAVHCSTAVQ